MPSICLSSSYHLFLLLISISPLLLLSFYLGMQGTMIRNVSASSEAPCNELSSPLSLPLPSPLLSSCPLFSSLLPSSPLFSSLLFSSLLFSSYLSIQGPKIRDVPTSSEAPCNELSTFVVVLPGPGRYPPEE